MDQFLEVLKQSTTSLGVAGAVVAMLASLIAQFIKSRLVRDEYVLAANEVGVEVEKKLAVDFEIDTRLAEARQALRRQETSARWNKWSMHSMTFGQYVVGGVLATSFIQAALSKETVGLLGVLVLVSSLIHQRFRPDLQYRNAKARASLLRKLIRSAEDEVFAIRSSYPDAKDIQAVRQMVSEGLSKVEALELADVSSENGNSVT